MSDEPHGPAKRENLVALRDRRETVIAQLTEQFTSDVIDVDELDRRIDVAHRARTVAELDDLIADLSPAPSTALTPATSAALDHVPQHKRWLCILGGVDKKGQWTPARRMRVVCVWGGANLDFRDAVLAPGVLELRVLCVMGGCHLIVPPHLAVEVDGIAIMGGFDELERGHGEPDPDRTLLRVTGFCLMGGVSVETRLAGESQRQARKRKRRELAAPERRALPGDRKN